MGTAGVSAGNMSCCDFFLFRPLDDDLISIGLSIKSGAAQDILIRCVFVHCLDNLQDIFIGAGVLPCLENPLVIFLNWRKGGCCRRCHIAAVYADRRLLCQHICQKCLILIGLHGIHRK